ncbi:MAG TPA: hypothetical protein VGR19_09210 [Allosphingosinicella sp.]|nr:hypothetical protein [Allosphingosinicella sp.]
MRHAPRPAFDFRDLMGGGDARMTDIDKVVAWVRECVVKDNRLTDKQREKVSKLCELAELLNGQ